MAMAARKRVGASLARGNRTCITVRPHSPAALSHVWLRSLHAASKPQSYDTETALASALIDGALSCTRYYFWDVWCVAAGWRMVAGRFSRVTSTLGATILTALSFGIIAIYAPLAQVREVPARARPAAGAVLRHDAHLGRGARREGARQEGQAPRQVTSHSLHPSKAHPIGACIARPPTRHVESPSSCPGGVRPADVVHAPAGTRARRAAHAASNHTLVYISRA